MPKQIGDLVAQQTWDEAVLLIDHLQWRIERAESAISDIMSRAGVLMGLAGIEIGYLAISAYTQNLWAKFGVGFLLGAIAAAIMACVPVTVDLGAIDELAEVSKGNLITAITIREHLVKSFEPARSQLQQLRKLNLSRSKALVWGYRSFLAAQICMAVFLFFHLATK